MKRRTYFGGCTTEKINGIENLVIDGYDGDKELRIWDAEIKDNPDSPEIVGISVIDDFVPPFSEDGDSKTEQTDREIFIHKYDCLSLAERLLNIHAEYQKDLLQAQRERLLKGEEEY